MKILYGLLIYLNSIILGVAVLIASPMLIVIFLNVVALRYLKDKPMNKEEFKNYCWTMYVLNCTERSEEGEGLITFLEYREKNEDFLKDKYERILKNEFQ
tara:strand:+ start:175 stop:474 length:300 start_codon:yes stop_codon:yes gene_type:complete